ncbi:MAG: MFS transporter [Candidatus Peregrinibacteria bacterium]
MMLRKIRTHHGHSEGRIFSLMVFIMGFGVSMLIPIFPNFVKSILHTDSATSLFYSGMALMMFAAAISSTIIFKKIQRTTITKISLLVSAIAFLLLVFVNRLVELSVINMIRSWFILFLIMSLALFVRDFSREKNLCEQEGFFYTFSNMGYLLGPLVGGFLAAYFGYEFVFALAAAVFITGLIYFYHKHVIQKHPAIINQKKTSTAKLIHNIKNYFKNPERTKIYLVTFALMSWFGFRRLYIPLYVVTAGFSDSITGIILAASIVPLILLEVAVGKYGDKKGIRIPVSAGFLIIALCLIGVYLSSNVWMDFTLLIIGNIGAALVEPLQESYLFKNLPREEEEDLYGIYMTADPMAYFLTPAIGAAILFLLPFESLFLIFGILILGASALAFTKLQY